MYSATSLIITWICSVYASYKEHSKYERHPTAIEFKISDSFSIFSSSDSNDPPTSEPKGLMNWQPPKYMQSLADFDDATFAIRSHLQQTPPHRNFKSNFLTLLHVIDGLAVHVAKYNWDSYNQKYNKLVKSFVDNAKRDPQGAIDEVNCILNAANRRIIKIRELLKNHWIEFLCRAKPTSCDTIVYGVLKVIANEELNQEAEFLLVLGQAGSNYLKLYSYLFLEVSSEYILTYLLTKNKIIQELVYKNSVLRRQIFPHGDKCPVQITPYLNYV